MTTLKENLASICKRTSSACLLRALVFTVFAIALPCTSHAATTTPNGIWLSHAEIAKLPMSGPAWDHVKRAADGWVGTPNLADQESDHDVHTLAIALVYARTGNVAYRTRAAVAIMSVIGTEAGGRTLALGRNLLSYVIAADLIDLRSFNAAQEAKFRAWITAVRTDPLDGLTLIGTHEKRPTIGARTRAPPASPSICTWAMPSTWSARLSCSKAGSAIALRTAASAGAICRGRPIPPCRSASIVPVRLRRAM
jgi:hypothetical protein